MNRIKIALVIVLLSFICANGYETPTKDIKAEDMVDKQLPKMDKKIWMNCLQFYANVRMVAKTTLKDMQAISNFAWSAQRQLQAVENAAKRIETIYKNIKNFRCTNPIDFVTNLEENVFQEIDIVKDYDVQEIKDRGVQLNKDREIIMNLGKEQVNAIARVSVKNYKWFERTFYNTQRHAQADPRITDDRSPSPARAVVSMSGTVISTNLAGADIRRENNENQAAMLASVVGVSGNNGGDVPVTLQTQVGKDNNRNSLVLALQENDIQLSAITTEAWGLMFRTKKLDRLITEKSLLVSGATEIANVLNSVDQNSRFVDRK